jgi:hypothetical protein
VTPWRPAISRDVTPWRPASLKSGWGYPWAVALTGAGLGNAYVERENVIRGNVIRSVEEGSDPDGQVLGVVLTSCEKGITESNLVHVNNLNPVIFDISGSLKFFNNQTPAGLLLQGTFNGPSPAQPANELTTDTALALALLAST